MDLQRPLRSLVFLTASLGPMVVLAGADRPASPRGQAAAQLAGKWIEVDYGRPLLRGRSNMFGAGADYGKAVTAGAPVWRAGANETTRLHTEVALVVGGKKVAPGDYDLFVELKEGAWTLIVSTQPAQLVGGAKAKGKIWGSYGYDASFDVVRVPMKVEPRDRSLEQFTIGFVDVNARGGTLVMAWERTTASVPFTLD